MEVEKERKEFSRRKNFPKNETRRRITFNGNNGDHRLVAQYHNHVFIYLRSHSLVHCHCHFAGAVPADLSLFNRYHQTHK